MTTKAFQKKVWDYYREHGRHDLPWRQTRDAYKILVSEVMLQQTQVARVIPKYTEFLKQFPTVQKLAKASTREVLQAWSGLGYNRRALYLQRAAEIIIEKYAGKIPHDPEILEELPGIGHYTARAVATFAWNEPHIFIETNIRAVFIHEFPPKAGKFSKITDKDLLLLIEKTLDRKNPREWYFALMDYGAHLKATIPNPSRKSAHHTKQSKFAGSDRQISGAIVKLVITRKNVTEKSAVRFLNQYPAPRVRVQWKKLAKENFFE